MSSVAIVGAGPSGLYAAQCLLAAGDKGDISELTIDVYERLDHPFGLLRHGVAPDHMSFARVQEALQAVLDDERVTFHGSQTLGETITRKSLTKDHDAVIYAVGAPIDTSIGIPGEDLPGSFGSGHLVKWYTGHPEAQEVSLDDVDSAAVVGVGNVALDIARLLSAPPGYLKGTHAPESAQAVLNKNHIKDVYVFGRRGPQMAAFTTKEVRELGHFDDVAVVIEGVNVATFPQLLAEAEDRRVQNNLKEMMKLAERTVENPRCTVHLRFWTKPVRANGTDKLESVIVEGTSLQDGRVVGNGVTDEVPVQLLVAAIGYRGLKLADIPHDEQRGVIPNDEGRMLTEVGGEIAPGEFVCGWCKRGATGIIGTAKSDANETVGHLVEYLKTK